MAGKCDAFSPYMKADAEGSTIRLHYVGAGQTLENSQSGANGNRIGVYSYTASGATAFWTQSWAQMSGGTSPTKWRINIDFGALSIGGILLPTQNVRKLRWTYSAALQA